MNRQVSRIRSIWLQMETACALHGHVHRANPAFLCIDGARRAGDKPAKE